ncbi:MAG TPA: 2-oxoacid:acceptor oxidoreductase subunit alpha [Patescibacteria group bacterium]
MSNKVYSIKIGGQAGQGIKSAGLIFSKIASRSGYHIYNYIEYPSLIRGGHNVMQTTFSLDKVYSQIRPVNFLIALNQETINLHLEELVEGAGIIFEDEGKIDVTLCKDKCRLFPVPLKKIAAEAGGQDIVSNNVALGAALALLGGDLKHLFDLIDEDLSSKDGEVVKINQTAAKAGYDYAKTNFADKFEPLLAPQNNPGKKMVVNGTDAVAYGAIAGGLQYAAIYPMSPTSNILSLLAANQEEYGYVYKQAEDEIAAINMAIGASFAGARSMTTTSGGGFCLMTEGFGLAGQTETPVVIVEGMRGGPGTGLPTWSAQGDLRFVLHSHQGDFPRIVIAAGDAEEAFHMIMKALNLAEKYQTPVVLLVDKNLLDDEQTFSEFDYSGYRIDRGKMFLEKDPEYHRYVNSEDGISPRTIPGLGNHLVANSDEHNSYGYSSETIHDRNEQVQKRLRKLDTCAKEDMEKPILYGPENADITIVSWGSNKGPILEAMKDYPFVNYLHITWMSPFPTDAVFQQLSKAKYLLNIECNSTAQMAGLIREKTGIDILDQLLKDDGRPFFPEEIREKINSILIKK